MRQPSQVERSRLRGRGAHRRDEALPAEIRWDDGVDLDATLDPAPRRSTPSAPSSADAESPFQADRWARIFLRNLLMVAVVGGIPTLAGLGIGASAWVTKSAVPVRQAAAEARGAQDLYFEALETSQPVLQELRAHGSQTGHIEDVFWTFLDSPADDRPGNADALLSVLDTEADQVRARRGADQDTVHSLLVPIHGARSGVTEAVVAWGDATKHPGAAIAVAVGLAPSPEEHFGRYAPEPEAR